MKLAITSAGRNLNSEVDPRFGRAKFFIVFDTESDEHKVVDNSENVNAVQGAGIHAAEIISHEDVDVLITGHCGPKAYRALKAIGVKILVGASGTVEDSILLYRKGELEEAEGPDVEGHWA